MSNQTPIEVRIMRLPHGRDLPLPQYQSALASGLDLLAAVPADRPVEILPGARAVIPTGIAFMKPVVAKLTTDDMIALAAYLEFRKP